MQQPRTRDGRYTFKPGAGDVPEASLGAPDDMQARLDAVVRLKAASDILNSRYGLETPDTYYQAQQEYNQACAALGVENAPRIEIAKAAGRVVLEAAEQQAGVDADMLADGQAQLIAQRGELDKKIHDITGRLGVQESFLAYRVMKEPGFELPEDLGLSDDFKDFHECYMARQQLNEIINDRTPYLELAEHYKATLAKIRPMGGEHEYHPKASAEARRAFDEAMACYPSEWIGKSSGHERKLLPKVSKTRAHYAHLRSVRKKAAKVFLAPENRRPAYAYTPYQKELSQEEIDAHPANIRSREGYMPVVMYDVEFGEQKPSGWGWQRWDDPKGLYSKTAWQRPKAGLFNDKNEKASEITTNHFGDGTYATCVHEMAHRMEATVGAGIVDAERSFLTSRSQGEEKVTLFGGSLHRCRPEIAYKTDLKDAYMGKIYDDDSFEIMSCGMEGLFGGSYDGLGGDRDMREFILGVLATG